MQLMNTENARLNTVSAKRMAIAVITVVTLAAATISMGNSSSSI